MSVLKISAVKGMIVAISLYALAWILVSYSTYGLPENPNDLTDTQGLPATTIYSMINLVLGVVSLGALIVGALILLLVTTKSFVFKFGIYIASVALLFVTTILNLVVFASYMIESVSGVLSGFLYLSVIFVLFAAAPKKQH